MAGKERQKAAYPMGLLVLAMGDAETHSRLVAPMPEREAEALQKAVANEVGREAWIGNKLANAFEYMGSPYCLMDFYNSYVSAAVLPSASKVLEYRSRVLYDAGNIERFKVFYVLPVLVVGTAGEARLEKGVKLSDSTERLEAYLAKVSKGQAKALDVLPVLAHRSGLAAAIDGLSVQFIKYQLKAGGETNLPEPVDPFFKVMSGWPVCLPAPALGGEPVVSPSAIKLPERLATPKAVNELREKGWIVENAQGGGEA